MSLELILDLAPARLSIGAVGQHPPWSATQTCLLPFIDPNYRLDGYRNDIDNQLMPSFKPVGGPGSWRLRRLFGTDAPLAWYLV